MCILGNEEGKVRENGEKGQAAARTKKARKLDEGPSGEVKRA